MIYLSVNNDLLTRNIQVISKTPDRRFQRTGISTYDDCSWMPDDRFQDAVSAAVDEFMGKTSEADFY